MINFSNERLPFAMRFATEPRFSVATLTDEIIAAYDPGLQMSSAIQAMDGSWCTAETSTGSQITGQDSDQYRDD